MSPESPRYRAGPGAPRGSRHKGINTRKLLVSIDENLYVKLGLVSQVTKIPKWRLVEQGLKLKFNDLRKAWNLDDWIVKMPQPHDIPDDPHEGEI